MNIPKNEFKLFRNGVRKELKNVNQKLIEFGVNSEALIKVEKGQPHEDGVVELCLSLVKLMDESEEDEILFEKQNLFKITIDPTITCS